MLNCCDISCDLRLSSVDRLSHRHMYSSPEKEKNNLDNKAKTARTCSSCINFFYRYSYIPTRGAIYLLFLEGEHFLTALQRSDTATDELATNSQY
jgi:hypothetical protein